MLRRRLPALLAATLLLALPATARGQASTTRGWNLGLHLQAASLSVEGGDAETGGGGGVRVGYGFNRIVTAFLAVDGATIDVQNAPEEVAGDWKMAHVDLGARFHFADARRRWVPWLEAAVGARAVGVDEAGEDQDVTLSGNSFTLGGGLSVYLKQTLALDVALHFTGGEFTDVEIGNVGLSGLDVDAGSTRFGLGLVWWP